PLCLVSALCVDLTHCLHRVCGSPDIPLSCNLAVVPPRRWSMWFNSKQREEPYQILTSFDNSRDRVFKGCQDLVRFFALLRIKPHAPPLVRVPVNSFEFQPCGRTPQAECLMR